VASFAAVFAVVLILGIDLWVYADAKRCAEAGAPVVFRMGTVVVDTPVMWFLSCLVLWVVAFPIYLVSRSG
jgi:hypothetical protein